MNFKIDLKILALEPQSNGLTLIEGLGTDGTSAVVSLRVAEPLVVGGWITMALFAEPTATQPAATAGPSMRERMQARANGIAAPGATQAPRSAMTAGVAAPAVTGEASSLLLSSILGNRGGTAAKQSEIPDNSPLVERNVDDEMDALFGAPRQG